MQYRINSKGKSERRKLQQRSMNKIFGIKFAAATLVPRVVKRKKRNITKNISTSTNTHIHKETFRSRSQLMNMGHTDTGITYWHQTTSVSLIKDPTKLQTHDCNLLLV